MSTPRNLSRTNQVTPLTQRSPPNTPETHKSQPMAVYLFNRHRTLSTTNTGMK